MKALLPYVVMLVLFFAGNKLVERQQQYNRSNQVSESVKPTALIGMYPDDSNASDMQLSSKPARGVNSASGK